MFEEKDIKVNIKSSISDNEKIKIPIYYFKEIIFKEIIHNLRHRNKEENILINIEIKSNFVIIEIENQISKDIMPGGSNGLYELKKVNDFPDDIFNFKSYKENKIYHQTLKIKMI